MAEGSPLPVEEMPQLEKWGPLCVFVDPCPKAERQAAVALHGSDHMGEEAVGQLQCIDRKPRPGWLVPMDERFRIRAASIRQDAMLCLGAEVVNQELPDG